MKKGDIITVYEDPVEETKPEGEAKILKVLGGPLGTINNSKMYFCEIQFLADGYKTERKILEVKK